MAQHLGLSSPAREIIRTLRTNFPEKPQNNKKLDRLLEQAYPLNSAASSLLRQEEIELLRKELDWFGEVVAADLAHHKGIQVFDHSPACQMAIATYQTGTRTMIWLGLLLFLCLISIIIILALFGSRNTFGCFSAGLLPGVYGLEIFCLYLVAGYFGHFIINFFQNLIFPESLLFKLIGNILFIGLIPLLILWPALFGIPLYDIRRSLGLHWDNFRKSIKDFFAGLMVFAAAWPFLYLILVLSAYIFSWLKIDMTKGIHPIAPVLMEAHTPGMISIIFILGVVVAPIVEEIMFRGVLYTWLRQRLNIAGAVVISAMVFAWVHPQGLIGFLPIAFLGAVLALLREWRNNLLAPIVAHAGFNLVSLIIIRFVLGN
jgi:membrane protease YdiL (CAAX protease family)